MEVFTCTYCPSTDAFSALRMERHIRLVHSHEPNFIIHCSVGYCARSFSNYRTYQNHLSSAHRGQSQVVSYEDFNRECMSYLQPDDVDFDDDGIHRDGGNEDDKDNETDLQSTAAKWILKTNETRELSRSTMLGIIDDISDLFEVVLSTCRKRTINVLKKNDLIPEDIVDLDTIFDVDIFSCLKRFHNLKQYYITNI